MGRSQAAPREMQSAGAHHFKVLDGITRDGPQLVGCGMLNQLVLGRFDVAFGQGDRSPSN